MARALLRGCLGCVRAILWLVLAAGLIGQLWLKDRWDPGAVVFYALPKPLLGLAALLLAAVSCGRQRAAALVAGAALASWWFGTSWCWNAPPEPESDAAPAQLMTAGPPAAPAEVRLIVWNLSRPLAAHADLIRLVREFQPHFVIGVEPGPNVPEVLPEYEKALPGYRAAFMPRGLLWLARVNSSYRERGRLAGLGAYAVFEVEDLGPAFRVVATDVYANPFLSRKPQLLEAFDHVRGRADAIIAGDFNTPLESAHWEEYRRHLDHAFETAGRGWRETWFWGLPVLSLDHVWVGRNWEVLAARHAWMQGSDHAAVLVTLRRR